MRYILIPILFLAWGLCVPGESAASEAYSYVDEAGQLHFVDSLHTIPDKYRARAEAVDDDANPEGVYALVKAQQHEFNTIVIDWINNIRNAQGMLPLSHAQKREWSGLTRRWTPIFLAAHVLLLMIVGIVAVHGFMNGHPHWAIATLLLMGLPAPIYCATRIGEANRSLKLLITCLSMVPAAALGWCSWEMSQTFSKLLG